MPTRPITNGPFELTRIVWDTHEDCRCSQAVFTVGGRETVLTVTAEALTDYNAFRNQALDQVGVLVSCDDVESAAPPQREEVWRDLVYAAIARGQDSEADVT